MIRIIYYNVSIFVGLLLVSLVILEVYIKSNLDRFTSYGWATNNQIELIVEDCKINNGTLGVFGDSFVE